MANETAQRRLAGGIEASVSRSNTNGSNNSTWKKYKHYELEVDPDQNDKAKEVLLSSFKRPHMRAFHCAWWSFFIAFFVWFAITPLLGQIQRDLNLSKQQVWASSMASVGGTGLMRLALGPLCDVYGARVLVAVILCAASIPAACTGLIQTGIHLIILRLFIGIAGGTFVMCQYWTSRFFCKEIVGTMNGLAGGWGNLGAGVTSLIIGSVLFPIFKSFFDGDKEKAWRTVCVVPAVIAFCTGIIVYCISDDSPRGNYSELKARGQFPPNVTTRSSFLSGAQKMSTWVLFVQYGCCFGVELTMLSATALYFRDKFGQSTEAAAAIVSIFGWLNLFARGLGGMLSDFYMQKCGMRGRLWVQAILLLAEGSLVLLFAHTHGLGGAIVCLVFFSFFVQASEGATYAIVPYVDPTHIGAVSGLVGAGGNLGALAFNASFSRLHYVTAFHVMGSVTIASAFLTALILINGYSRLLWGRDLAVDVETGVVLQPKDKSRSSKGSGSKGSGSKGSGSKGSRSKRSAKSQASRKHVSNEGDQALTA